MNQFVPLQIRSEYSLVDSIVRIPDLLASAKRLNMPAVALTDRGNLFAACKFYSMAEKAGIKPILGAELIVTNKERPSQPPHSLIVLCQNNEGFVNLNRLITASYRAQEEHGKVCVERHWLRERHAGLIVLAPGIRSDIGHAIADNNTALADQLAMEWQSMFPTRYYLALTRTQHAAEEHYITAAVILADQHHIPVVATNDTCFLLETDYEAHEARFCIQNGYLLDDPKRPKLYAAVQYLRSAEEMAELFHDIPSALTNTVEIAKRCNTTLALDQYHLPVFTGSVGDQETQLRQLAASGLDKRLSDHPIKTVSVEYQKRLDDELAVISKMGFSGYFLIVADFIHWARENDVPVGPGRGSGAGSLVSYALCITELDPIQYDLIFERFLNPERISLPDLDIDFCMDKRDQVIQYAMQKYGADRVAHIVTHGTMAARAVIRDVGRVLGYPYGLVDQLAKLVPFELHVTLADALKEGSDLERRYAEDEEVRSLIDLARKLEGLCRNAGRHAGGIVIAPEPLVTYMPLFCEPNALMITQFDMEDVAACGLVKFDFLGLKTLTVIDLTLRYINKQRQEAEEDFSLKNIPIDDPETYRLIQRTDTTAVFQLESDGMKKLIKRLEPSAFEELIALIALFRPGPLQSGMVDDYIERKHGRQRVQYSHPLLHEILHRTYGVILYQEQVMQAAQVLAGYSMGRADLLRRAMGKKKAEEMMRHRKGFIDGAKKNGIKHEVAAHIFDLMEKFSGYGFNRSHSAAYALISYQTAWLKSHHPSAFMAATLSCDMQDTDRVVALRDESVRMRIILLPPSVNNSDYMFRADNEATIRFGLGAIKGLGQAAVGSLIEERECNGNYRNIMDLCQRNVKGKINRRALEALIQSGSLDELGTPRNNMIRSLDTYVRVAGQLTEASQHKQVDLFNLQQSVANLDAKILQSQEEEVCQWSEEERLLGEKRTLGFYLEGHPMSRYADELNCAITCKIAKATLGRHWLAGYIDRIRSRSSSRGRMAEVYLDDESGRIPVTVYAEEFRKFRHLLVKDQMLVVHGEVVEDEFSNSRHSLTAHSLYSLADIRAEFAHLSVSLGAGSRQNTETAYDFLKGALKPYSGGSTPVFIRYQSDALSCRLDLGKEWSVTLDDKLLDLLREYFGEDNLKIDYRLVASNVRPMKQKYRARA